MQLFAFHVVRCFPSVDDLSCCPMVDPCIVGQVLTSCGDPKTTKAKIKIKLLNEKCVPHPTHQMTDRIQQLTYCPQHYGGEL